MLNDRLAAAKRAGNRCYAALCDREQRINNTLARDHRLGRSDFFCIWTAAAHRPLLEHGQFDLLAVLFKLCDRLDDVGLSRVDPGQFSGYVRRHHDLMEHSLRFLHGTENVARDKLVTDFGNRDKVPELFVVERINNDTACDAVAGLFTYNVQRTLDAVINGLDESRSELDRQGRAGRYDRFAGADASGLFIDLYGCAISAQLDHLANQMLLRHANNIVHLHVRHAAGNDKRARNLNDRSLHK